VSSVFNSAGTREENMSEMRCKKCAYSTVCAVIGMQKTFAEYRVWVCARCGRWFKSGGKIASTPKCDPLARRYAHNSNICLDCYYWIIKQNTDDDLMEFIK